MNVVLWISFILAGIPHCPGDVTLDSLVDVQDLVVVVANWGLVCPPDPVPCLPDENGDNTVDVLDLVQVVTHWGVCP